MSSTYYPGTTDMQDAQSNDLLQVPTKVYKV